MPLGCKGLTVRELIYPLYKAWFIDVGCKIPDRSIPNNLWRDEKNTHSIRSFSSPDLEYLTLLCRPYWLPREFTAVIITAVYIPPPANTDQALEGLYGNISQQETALPEAEFIVTGLQQSQLQNNSSKILSTHHHKHAWRLCFGSPLLLLTNPFPPIFWQIRSLVRSALAHL